MSTVDHWFEFYNENRDKLLVGIEDHSPNYEAIDRWINKQEDDCSYMLATMFRKYLRYITFDEFYTKLQEIAQDVREAVSANKFDRVVLMTTAHITKSNFWGTLLISPYINDLITDVISDPYQLDIIPATSSIMILLIDDMTHTGSQMDNIIQNLRLGAHEGMNIYFHLGLCYATNRSYRLLSSRVGVHISNHTEIIDTFYDQLASDPEYNNFLETNGITQDQCLFNDEVHHQAFGSVKVSINPETEKSKSIVYFQFKLPDSLSTFHEMISRGCYYSKTYPTCHDQQVNKVVDSLVKGCESGKPCFKTPYSQIKYTYRSISITSYDVAKLLLNPESVGVRPGWISIDNWVKFVDANDSLLSIGEKYPEPTAESMDLAIASQFNTCSMMKTIMTKKYVRYISMETFANQLALVIADLRQYVEFNKYTEVVLYVPSRSFWTTMLATDALKDITTYVIEDLAYFSYEYMGDNVLLVVLTDCLDDSSSLINELGSLVENTAVFLGACYAQNNIVQYLQNTGVEVSSSTEQYTPLRTTVENDPMFQRFIKVSGPKCKVSYDTPLIFPHRVPKDMRFFYKSIVGRKELEDIDNIVIPYQYNGKLLSDYDNDVYRLMTES